MEDNNKGVKKMNIKTQQKVLRKELKELSREDLINMIIELGVEQEQFGNILSTIQYNIEYENYIITK